MAGVCKDEMHQRAVDALHSLSATQFGRAALERHGHQPVPIEVARAYSKPPEPTIQTGNATYPPQE